MARTLDFDHEQFGSIQKGSTQKRNRDDRFDGVHDQRVLDLQRVRVAIRSTLKTKSLGE